MTKINNFIGLPNLFSKTYLKFSFCFDFFFFIFLIILLALKSVTDKMIV